MKKRGVFLPLLLAFLAMSSCDVYIPRDTDGTISQDPDGNGSQNTDGAVSFYAQNMTNGKYYQVKAEKLHEGRKCIVWAELGSGIDPVKAAQIAAKYDNDIYPKIVPAFGMTDFDFDGTHFNDIMEFSSWLVDGDGKLTILLLDIKDGYKKDVNNSFIAGYFQAANFFSKEQWSNSNETDMIYIDTYPSLEDPEEVFTTFAHELQHLINFVTSICQRTENQTIIPMDTWIDEGLSSQSEYLYLEEHPYIRYGWFMADPVGTIAQGNNFFVWDNYKDEPSAILDEYATVYLFFQWLYLQADNTLRPHLLKDIATSHYSDYRAVTDLAKQIRPQWDNWEILLRTWLVANAVNDPSSEYGYKDDPDLGGIHGIGLREHSFAKGDSGKKVNLYPGEGVYSWINAPYSPSGGSGSNIKYVGISPTLNDTAPYNEKVLLTFNRNTKNNAKAESGYVTGIIPDPTPAASVGAVARTLAPVGEMRDFGPRVLDARDVLGRQHEADLIKTLSAKYLQYANK